MSKVVHQQWWMFNTCASVGPRKISDSPKQNVCVISKERVDNKMTTTLLLICKSMQKKQWLLTLKKWMKIIKHTVQFINIKTDSRQTDRQTDTVQAAAATCSTPDPAQLMTWGSSSCSPSRCSCKIISCGYRWRSCWRQLLNSLFQRFKTAI